MKLRQKLFAIFLKLIQIGLVVIAALSMVAHFGEWNKVFDFAAQLRLQYLTGASVGLVIALARRWCVWSVVALLGIALNFWPIAMWYGTKNSRAENLPRLKLVQSNVYFKATHYQELIDYLRAENPDIVTLQEVNSAWAEGLKPLNEQFQDARIWPAADGNGVAIFSRIKFEKAEMVDLGGDHRPNIWVQFDWQGRKISLLTMHPPNPFGAKRFEWRNEQLANTAAFLNKLPAPKIMVGDLNITMWSPYYQKLVAQTQLVNAREGYGVIPTWHSKFLLPPLMIPIDHCLVSADIDVLAVRAGDDVGSDHLPLIVELAIPQPR